MKTTNPPTAFKPNRLLRIKMLTLVGALLAPAAGLMAQTLWVGTGGPGTNDYNNASYWNPATVPSGTINCTDDAGSNNVILIQAGDPAFQHGDTLAGNAANTSGAWLQTGSTNFTGGGNWFRMAVGTGTYGSYVLSNGLVQVGGQTHIGETGTGYLEVDGGTFHGIADPFCVGDGDFGPNPVGYMVINGGTVNADQELWIGEGNSTRIGTGTLTMNGGTLNIGSWFDVGRWGGIGYLNMNGGTINKTSLNGGNTQFAPFNNGGSYATINMTGGTINIQSGDVQVGVGGNGTVGSSCVFNQSGGTFHASGQYQIATDNSKTVATNNLSGNAVLTVDNWLAVGRNGGNGTLNISGNATVTKTGGGGNLTIGSGGASTGVINQSGGTVTNTAAQTYIGESGTSSGTWNMTNGTAILGNVFLAYADSAIGVLSLEGGTFRATSISSPTFTNNTTSILDLNGGTLQAGANNSSFVSSLYAAFVDAGGAVIDSQGYNIGIPQALTVFGPDGGLTKLGSGTLTLTGANNYSGDTTINGGTLFTTTASTTPGSVLLADNTGFGIAVLSAGGQYSANNLTLGTSVGTTLNFNMGGFGNPDLAHAPLVVATLSNNGVTTVNLADANPQVGEFPLVKYNTLAGAGSFVLGSIPVGVTASIVTNAGNSSIDLNIAEVNLPRWDGQAGGTWDTGSDTNWVNIGTGLPTTYSDPSLVQFNDQALGTTSVNVTTTVNPLGVTVTNNTLSYSIVGTGKISGSGGISKQGSAALALLNTGGNDFTGPVTVVGGTLSVTNLPNDGVAGPIGKGSLILAGGNFSYSGPATSVSHSYTTTASGSTLTTVNNLKLTGGTFAAGTGGGLNKSGLASLTYAQTGSNVLADASSGGYDVQDGSVIFDGSVGGQINFIGNVLGLDGKNSVATVLVTNSVIDTPNIGLNNNGGTTNVMTIDGNSTVSLSSWMIFNNGGAGESTLNLNSGTLNVNNGKILMGGAPAPGGVSTSILNINGGILNNAGGNAFDIGDGGWNGSGVRTGIVNQSGGTNNCNNPLYIGYVATGIGFYNLTNGQLNISGLTEVGNGDATTFGTFNILNGTVTCSGGMDVGNYGGVGTLNMSNGTLGIHNWFTVGRYGSTGCVVNMSGGVLTQDTAGNVDIGTGAGDNTKLGGATFNQSGGIFNAKNEYWIAENTLAVATNNISGTAVVNASSFVRIGNGGHGMLNLSGGSFNQTGGNPFIVGISGGTGNYNQSGGFLTSSAYLDIADGSTGNATISSGTANFAGDIWVGQNGGGNGTLTISGGAVTNGTWLAVGRAGANGVFNISGGIYVRANAGGGAGGPNVSVANGGGSGTVTVSGTGYVNVSAGDTWIGEGSAGTWNQNGGTAINSYVQLGRNAGATGNLSLNGGVFAASQIAPGGGTSTMNFNGGTLKATASNANFLSGLGQANVMAGGAVIDCGGNAIAIGQPLLDAGGGLTNIGSGTLYLNGINSYLGQTTISAGTLGGVGTFASAVSVASGAALAPGTASATGTMTINSNLTLAAGSSTHIKISLDGGPNNDQVAGLTSVTYAGTLVVTNIGATSLAGGGSFHLFSAAAHTGNFSNAGSVTILPSGTGTFDPATGTLTVTGVTVNPPTLSGGNLVMTGSGTPGASYTWLSATNLSLPVALWATNSQGLFSASGMCTNIYTVTNPPVKFFRLRTP